MNGYFPKSFWAVYENDWLADKTGVGNALSKMVSGGASLEMIERLLGHTQIGATQRYSHLIDSPLRAWVIAVGEMLKHAAESGGRVTASE